MIIPSLMVNPASHRGGLTGVISTRSEVTGKQLILLMNMVKKHPKRGNAETRNNLISAKR
jgi:hypothetical protein